jgi:hypothetical protein
MNSNIRISFLKAWQPEFFSWLPCQSDRLKFFQPNVQRLKLFFVVSSRRFVRQFPLHEIQWNEAAPRPFPDESNFRWGSSKKVSRFFQNFQIPIPEWELNQFLVQSAHESRRALHGKSFGSRNAEREEAWNNKGLRKPRQLKLLQFIIYQHLFQNQALHNSNHRAKSHITDLGRTSCYWACATVSSLTMGSVRPKLCATAIMCKMPRTNSALSQLPGMPYVNTLGSTLTPSKNAIVGT